MLRLMSVPDTSFRDNMQCTNQQNNRDNSKEDSFERQFRKALVPCCCQRPAELQLLLGELHNRSHMFDFSAE